VTVRADLSAPPRSQPSMSGFLHGLGAPSPPIELVRPLRPRLWRSDLARAPYESVTELGARYELVLSDLWGYPASGWGGRGPPYADLGAWERFVRRTARSQRGRQLLWDVWNEPNADGFWQGTRAQYFRVYEVAERTLRAVLGPEVEVGGPSTAGADRAWLEGLLAHCRRRGCRVRFLSWHENLEPGHPIAAITGRLRRARAALLGPYRDVGLRTIQINEVVGAADQYRPGEILGYLYHLEAGGADAAVRACWPDTSGSSNCSNGTVDGLIAPDGRPRAAWWAYERYADGVATRVPSSSSDPAVASLASARLESRVAAQVLLARLDRGAGARPLTVELALDRLERLESLTSDGRVLVSVRRLPDSGEAALGEPPPLQRKQLELDDGALRLRAGALRPHEALIVTIAAP
jgi:xylan 1,4-beta-xylosidase